MDDSQHSVTRFLRTLLGPVFVLLVLTGALRLLHQELQGYQLRDFFDSLVAISPRKLWMAAVLTLVNYLILIGYDLLGIRYIRQQMSFCRVALASFLSYAVGNSFGMLLGGSAIRYRLYSAWGLSSIEIVKLVLLLSVTFWIGLFALAGVMFTFLPPPVPDRLHLPMASTLPIGIVCLVVVIGYLLLCGLRRSPVRIRAWDFQPPSIWLAIMQFAVSAIDLTVAASVLYVLLPESVETGFLSFLSIYLLAIIAAFLSQVPSGLGVIELVLLYMLKPTDPQTVIGSLMAYRAIYYFVPLGIGIAVLGANEAFVLKSPLNRLAGIIGKLSPVVAPRLLSLAVFLTGSMLLLSGATPAAQWRLNLLRHVLPLSLLELSHFMNSIIGLLLLLVARGLHRRVETAYYAAAGLLAAGIAVSMLKGFDFEEAFFLSIMLAALLPCRRHFYRHGALRTLRFTTGWFLAIGIVLSCSAWLILFSFQHVEYRDDLWWQFAFHENAPRSLRAFAGATTLLLVITSCMLLRAHRTEPGLPDETDLQDARRIIKNTVDTSAHLALLGDKRFFFNADRTALIMYGIEGRSWISMGDPIGEASALRELAWDFLEFCDEGGRWPVFYQIPEDSVPMYVEMGMTLIKLGEEASVSLTDFSLEGGNRRNLRRTYKQLTEEGCTFEIIEAPISDVLIEEFRRISDAWLADKSTAEKGFSLGFFSPNYLRGCPVALVRQANRVIAFANIWQGAGRVELSIDLMRYIPDAPQSTMEYLFIALMLWGHNQGYQRFSLGMAPLSGMDDQRLAPLWTNIAALAFRHGEHFYNFRGLRQYKEKFHPTWRARYLASRGGFALPLILAHVATLVSGGLRKLVAR